MTSAGPAALRLLAMALVSGAVVVCGGGQSGTVRTDRVDLPKSYLFSPANVAVKAGTTVTWTNNDNFTHSVRLPRTTGQIVGIMSPGASVTYTFDKPGVYEYDCSFHPNDMKGTVTVE